LAADPARRVAVVGTGYVGLVTGTCLAQAGAHVTCLDVDPKRIATLKAGKVPFLEPGLPALVTGNHQAGRLAFTTDPQEALGNAHVAFLAVGTPSRPDGSSDLSYLHSALETATKLLPKGAVIVIRSTVPPGTGDKLQDRVAKLGRADLQLVSAPEFLAEGTAVRDFQNPDRLVFGGPEPGRGAVASLFASLRPESPRILTDRPTAELVKYTANTFLAARVSLINEIARLCDAWGADVRTVSRAVGLDPRVGALFLRPGVGYGGSCFPKDVQALAAAAKSAGIELAMVPAIEQANDAQWRYAFEKARGMLGGDLSGKRGEEEIRQDEQAGGEGREHCRLVGMVGVEGEIGEQQHREFQHIVVEGAKELDDEQWTIAPFREQREIGRGHRQ